MTARGNLDGAPSIQAPSAPGVARRRPEASVQPAAPSPSPSGSATGAIAHPLIVPLPRLLPPIGVALRRAALSRLRSTWQRGRLDVTLPGGARVRLGGAGPAEAAVQIHDDRMFLRLLLRGELGGGEAYVAGEWSTDDLVGALRVFLRATGARGFESPLTRLAQLPTLLRHKRAANTRDGSERNIHAHYDLGNALYELFLDPATMMYSSAYWPALVPGAPYDALVPSLADAQRAKLDRLCAQLDLGPGDHLLEIGCGWGGMAIHAAATRGCKVTAITVSREQHALAAARVQAAGLAERVDIVYCDYRDLRGTFDKVVSIEMLEAVGYEYLPTFFHTCARVLRPGGALALQSITMPHERFDAYRRQVDWMQTYIFPGSCIPSVEVVRQMAARAGLRITDALDIGPSYAPTLRAWREAFVGRLSAVRALGYDEPFIRTWLMYLAFSEAAFAERTLGDHQLLLRR